MNENADLRAAIVSLNERVRRLEAHMDDAAFREEISSKLDDIGALVSGLAEVWEVDIEPEPEPEPEPAPAARRRRAQITRIIVKMSDDTIIDRRFAADAFADAIEHLGVERVKSLDIWINGRPLVSENAPSGTAGYRERSGVYIHTSSATKSKKWFLEDIASRLGESLTVKIVPRHGATEQYILP